MYGRNPHEPNPLPRFIFYAAGITFVVIVVFVTVVGFVVCVFYGKCL